MASKKMNDIDATSPDELGHFKHHFSITMELDKHPWMTVMAAVAAGLVIIYILAHAVKNKATSSTVVPATPASTTNTTGTTTTYVPPPINVTVPPTTGTTTTPPPGGVTTPNPPAGTTTPVSHPPGTTFLGPTGVKHYVALGGESLSSIASKLTVGTWNSIYAIPENMAQHGGPLPAMDANHARVYVPPRGTVLVY